MSPDASDFDVTVGHATILPTEESFSYESRTALDKTTLKDITTTELSEISTDRELEYSTFKPIVITSSKSSIQLTEIPSEDSSTAINSSNVNESTNAIEPTTILANESAQNADSDQTQYEMIQLIENIVKNISDEKTNTTSVVQRKEDSSDTLNKTATTENKKDQTEFADLGEIKESYNNSSNAIAFKSTINKLNVPTLAPILNDLKMKIVNALKNTNTIDLDPAPKQSLGLEESTANVNEVILEFTKICNEVAFNFWIALNNEGGISSARSLILSPFALTSMLGKFISFNFHSNTGLLL